MRNAGFALLCALLGISFAHAGTQAPGQAKDDASCGTSTACRTSMRSKSTTRRFSLRHCTIFIYGRRLPITLNGRFARTIRAQRNAEAALLR